MKNDLLKHTKTTKGRKFHTEIYSKDEVMALVGACNNGLSGLRNKVLIIVLYRCGLRISEALGIRASDYNAKDATLRVIGKGNKMRVVGLDSQTKMNFDLWMMKRKELGINGAGNPPIFCGISKQNFAQPIQTAYVRNLLKRLAKKAGVEKRMNPHNFRHSFAHDLLNEGIGLQHIQISLGHSSISTTSKYLQRFNPRETIEKIKQRVW
ncbi:MAG: tyrosine-type recombinase/integrase [Deltaproteobacteria bacterium]